MLMRSLFAAALLSMLAGAGHFPRVAVAQGPDVDRARLLFVEGQRAYDAGRFEEAAEKMKAAYELTRSPELAFNVGRVYERMSEYNEAIRYFRIYARRGQPSESELADIRRRIRALAEARDRQQSVVYTGAPSTDALTAEARAFFLRGVAMFEQGQFDAAMVAFTAAHQFAPLPEVLYNMAVTSERLGNLRDAVDYYREYLRVRRDAPDRGHVEREIARLRSERRSR